MKQTARVSVCASAGVCMRVGVSVKWYLVAGNDV